jgi:hypothetical protein
MKSLMVVSTTLPRSPCKPRRGDLQPPADRLDPLGLSMLIRRDTGPVAGIDLIALESFFESLRCSADLWGDRFDVDP